MFYKLDYTAVPTGPASEIYQRIGDDHFRDGFRNLGSGNDFLIFQPTSQNLKINAQGGDDALDFGSTSTAQQGNHTVYGGTGDDTLLLGSGDDTVFAGFDDDHVEGGLGDDMIYGGQGDDQLVGDSMNFLSGGNDRIFGGSGRDTLIGLRGADEMTGGADADTFVFFNRAESTPGARDHVLDFSSAQGDRFDFNAMDANTTLTGNQNFDFEEGPSARAGTIWATGSGADWTVFVNVDGGAADMAIDVTLAGGATEMLETDFIV